MNHTATAKAYAMQETTSTVKSEYAFIQSMEEQRLILFPAMLLFMLCINGIVASFGTQGHLAEIILVLIPNVFTVSFVIGVAPTRWVLLSFAFNILLNLIVLWI